MGQLQGQPPGGFGSMGFGGMLQQAVPWQPMYPIGNNQVSQVGYQNIGPMPAPSAFPNTLAQAQRPMPWQALGNANGYPPSRQIPMGTGLQGSSGVKGG